MKKNPDQMSMYNELKKFFIPDLVTFIDNYNNNNNNIQQHCCDAKRLGSNETHLLL